MKKQITKIKKKSQNHIKITYQNLTDYLNLNNLLKKPMITTKDLRPGVGSQLPYDLIVHSISPFLLPDTTQCCVYYPLHSILFLDRSLYRDMLRYLPP